MISTKTDRTIKASLQQIRFQLPDFENLRKKHMALIKCKKLHMVLQLATLPNAKDFKPMQINAIPLTYELAAKNEKTATALELLPRGVIGEPSPMSSLPTRAILCCFKFRSIT